MYKMYWHNYYKVQFSSKNKLATDATQFRYMVTVKLIIYKLEWCVLKSIQYDRKLHFKQNNIVCKANKRMEIDVIINVTWKPLLNRFTFKLA